MLKYWELKEIKEIHIWTQNWEEVNFIAEFLKSILSTWARLYFHSGVKLWGYIGARIWNYRSMFRGVTRIMGMGIQWWRFKLKIIYLGSEICSSQKQFPQEVLRFHISLYFSLTIISVLPNHCEMGMCSYPHLPAVVLRMLFDTTAELSALLLAGSGSAAPHPYKRGQWKCLKL